MTTYNTGNPIGSASVKDLYDNAENLDVAINSPTANVWADRLGQPRKTWRGIENDAQLDIAQAVAGGTAQAEAYRDESLVARDDARAAASAIGPLKFYDTYAQAMGDIGALANGDLIEVSQDETRAGARTRYKVHAGALVFVVNLDQVRIDLASVADANKGAAMVALKHPGAGAVARTVDAKLREFVSVKDFGAVGDGVTDDTAAINAAMSYSTRPTVYFPAGTYLTTAPIVSNGSYVHVYGDGIYSTIIKCSHTGDGFSFGASDPSGLVRMHDMSIQTVPENSNSAVNIIMANSGTATINPSCEIERIETRGFDVNTVQWKNGISVKNASVSYFKDTLHFGASNATPSSLETKGSCGILMSSDRLAVIHTFNNVFAINACFGIKVESSGSKGSEGLYITGCNTVNCNYGYYIDNTTATAYRPVQVGIYNCHSEFYKYGIVVNKFNELTIRDNLLYAFDYPGDIARRAVLISNCMRGCINGNITHSNSNNVTLKGVEVGNESAFINVFDNINNTPSWGVVFTGQTTNCREERNVQRHPNNVRFADQSSGLNYSSPFKVLFGSSVVTLDANGYGAIPIAGSGSGKPLYVLTNGDSNNHGDKTFSIYDAGSSASTLAFRVFPNPGAATVRVNWSAYTYS